MILLKRTLPVLIGLLTFVGIFLISWWQAHIWILLALTVLVVVLGLGMLSGWGADLERWGVIAITPALFVSAAVAFMLFVQDTWLLVVIATTTAIFIALFLEHVFRFIFAPGLYQPYALEHTSIVLHIASVYFFTTMFYGLNMFLHVPIWILALIFFVLAMAYVYETLWVSKIPAATAVTVSLLGAWLLVQLFVAVSFLPTSFFVDAALISVAFYVLLGVLRARLLQRLSELAMRRYAYGGGALAALILFTAKWI
ncbi:hypothetical protein A3B32_02055 [Candidatus Uhrbacteria bacterium RIFCSPLOWO2_01_FULL_53_9]|uniref:Uncharacterized protein n=1 Tax=Candidatus Uhrbacteria bacterium RIFCSPLOWO2_01_FULL_53_9 TaxID=1802403 RepID=A0A1F7UYA7_9BACT|nr:MAG: hypothetical protein A3B32_02055 [Candidatus Uhrbacteria bacterium RIFCSPLOWO2_01_FULL_53_9]